MTSHVYVGHLALTHSLDQHQMEKYSILTIVHTVSSFFLWY